MSDTPVEDVTTPTRKAKASSAAIVNRITTPASRKRGWSTCVFQTTIAHIDADEVDEVRRRQQQPAGVPRQQQRHRPTGRER